MTYSVSQLKPNVYHIADPLGVFMTLIVGEEKALLLDTGHGLAPLDNIITQITNLPLIVVNSHGHLDHVLGNRFFDEAYLHPADLQLYHLHTAQNMKRSITDMQRNQPELFPVDFSPEAYLAPFNTRILPVNEGDIFELGGVSLTVVHTPGHTHGGIALLDDRDRLLLSGDAASPHVWLFLPESTSIPTYIQSLRELRNLSNLYDGIIASHVSHVLPNDIIDRLIHCAENIDLEKSILLDPPFADLEAGLMYYEGLNSLKDSLNMETLDLTKQAFYTLNLDNVDFSKTDFVSIVYDETKL